MKLSEIRSELKKSPISAWYYIQGNVRLMLYRNKVGRYLLRRHIIEQFEWRRDVAANECYKLGSCRCCGCDTPALFFAVKACIAGSPKCKSRIASKLKQCYPPLMDSGEWKYFIKQNP